MGFKTLILSCVVCVLVTRQVQGCGYVVKAIDREQTVTSPGFPNGYSTFVDCTWTLQAVHGSHVFINITDFDLGGGDYLNIYDGSYGTNLLARYTGLTSLTGKQSTFTTRSDKAIVYFNSNYNDDGSTGFSLKFAMDCLDNDKCIEVGAKAACADQDVGQTFCPKLCGSCPNLVQQLLG